jgi:thioredoxin-like negative regulator of GroEL
MKNLFKDKEVAKELSKFDFQVYDIDKSPDLKNKYKVTKIPTMIFIKEAKQNRYVGGMSKQKLLQVLRKEK